MSNGSPSPLPAGASLVDFIKEKTRSGKRVFTTSRSAAITYQRCPRRRWLGYHYEGTGITKTKLAAPLATGGYTHVALAELLKGASASDAAYLATGKYNEELVARGLDLESTEDQEQVAREQSALVVAFTHLAARRIIPAIKEEYEIVDIEREEWFVLYEDAQLVVVMEARSDGLLREKPISPAMRAQGVAAAQGVFDANKLADSMNQLATNFQSGDLYVLSWKTAASWDRRKAREAKTDMQGLSEAYAIELRIGEPVMGTKMVHILKGKREQYPEDSGKYIQKSPLIYAWMQGAGPTPQFAWTYAWDDPDQINDWGRPVKHKLGKGWRRVFIPDIMPVAEWIEMLDSGQVQPEAGDCLERQFISPMPEPRSPEQKQAWLRQVETQELAIAEYVKIMEGEPDKDELLDSLFPQYTHSCNYPTQCAFWDLCWSSEEVDNPITLYQIREPHHPGEQMIAGDE